jgi:hypothetical protein
VVQFKVLLQNFYEERERENAAVSLKQNNKAPGQGPNLRLPEHQAAALPAELRLQLLEECEKRIMRY